jgi:IS30 family transposase
MSCELDLFTRYSIISLSLHAGWSQQHIANQFNCSRSTVSRTLQRWMDSKDVENRPRTGRPPLVDITNINNNPLTQIIRSCRQLTGKQLQTQMQLAHDIKVSLSTIYRLRRKLNYRSVRFRRVPHLTDENKKTRLQYVLECEGEDWDDIIFTDESIFELSNGRGKYLKRP